jgi:hypothetical protein
MHGSDPASFGQGRDTVHMRFKTRTLGGSRADRETSYCFVAGAFELHMS